LRNTLLLLPLIALALSVAGTPGAPAPARVPVDTTAKARTLVRWAREGLADSSVEARQRAIRDLEAALRLRPDDPEAWRTLGRAYELGRYGQMARDCYRRSIRLAPRQPDGYMELGMAWKRAWIRTQDTTALDQAIAAFDTVTALRPYGADGWLRLVPLRYEHGDPAGAAAAAERALAGRPRRPAALLAVAYTAFRRGEIERADSAFAAAIPRLDPTLRALFDRPSWIGLGRARGGSARADAPADPWAGLDPDPTSPQNELKLEYWSRVAHAYFVFYDPLWPELDSRAETYVRYGPPRGVELNPPGVSKVFSYGIPRSSPGQILADYPLDALVWSYPDLGMRIVLQDRSLTGRFTPAATKDFDPQSVPDPRVLARRGDLVALDGGLAVFSTLPPREQRLDLQGVVARFEGAGRPRLVAQVQAPGQPGDTLLAKWVVLDSTGREISREARPLAVSACDPTRRRVTEFASELPPGAFQVVVSVRDMHRRRGLFRAPAALAPLTPALALSDVLLTCGDPALMSSGGTVRLEANIEGRVAGRQPLYAYFEIYRLAAGGDGLAHFEYEYTVRRVPPEATGLARLFVFPEAPVISRTSREEAQVGTLRRQFVSVPTQSLAAGRYRLEVRVRDLATGAQARGTAEFTRE